MRIISGNKKGLRFNVPRNFKARPTTDFAKEGLFNILDNMYYFEGLRILDLFAGSGSITLEFLSHGVESVTSIEKNNRYAKHIENLAEKIFPNIPVSILNLDVFDYLKTADLNFDIIFADPPYADEQLNTLPDLIFGNLTLPDDSLVIIEHPKHVDFSKHRFFRRHRRYGNVNFSFFSKEKI